MAAQLNSRPVTPLYSIVELVSAKRSGRQNRYSFNWETDHCPGAFYCSAPITPSDLNRRSRYGAHQAFLLSLNLRDKTESSLWLLYFYVVYYSVQESIFPVIGMDYWSFKLSCY